MTAPAAADRRRRGSGLDPHSDTFRAFADVLYVGILVFALSLPLVTWFAALSAGVQALREARAGDGHVTVGAVWRAFARRIRRHWFVHVIAPTVLAAFILLDALVLPFLGVGEMVSAVVPIVLAAVAGAVGLRVAGAWRDDLPARRNVATAWRRMSQDAAGSVLLILAVTAAGAVVSVIPMLVFVMAGPLALAAVAMDRQGSGAE
ncbi:hypothetical protein CVS47_02904 [Microbacterium lemovicicum]|uniref:Uncharacterized protein n=1 Tax=Microbacterium lemovicicum TaxID=1072463 RepID=A0A3Q9J270_9MICO|nr:hypothetical protein [Microbacterium lemovicicum]AZS38251.1 hypothetical protein CVS47_02904 [Microbacterium lemovicicum]